MKTLAKLIGILSVLLLIGGQADAADQKAQAIALMDKAIAHFKEVGAEQAFKDFSDPKGGYQDGSIYVVVQDMDGNMVHHSTNAKLNGRNVTNLKDADGKLFNVESVETVKKSGEGWVQYKWTNPETKKIGQKNSYLKKVSDTLYFIVGYYE